MSSAMPANATSHATAGNRRRDFLVMFACLAVLLSALFHKSFLPNYVVFSNDGPLGQVQSQAEYALSNLRAYWQDLNWIGIEQLPGFPTIGYSVLLLLGPVGYSKFIAPLSLIILGLSAWFCFRRMGFAPWVCLLGGLAAALDMTVFSINCWGLYGWTLQRACAFLALAALAGPSARYFSLRLSLAGLCVGMGIMEGFDVGAIFSLYVAAFVVFQTWAQDAATVRKLLIGTGRVAVVAASAALIAAHALTALIGTQVKGVVGMQQDEQTKRARWHEATQWSLPPIETLRIVIPGLFGYYLVENAGDRPPQKAYWGRIAEDPRLPELLRASESSDPQVRAEAGAALHRVMRRHTGSGEYAGVAVVFVAFWGVVQSFRRKHNPFSPVQRKFIWFWGAAAIISLLLAFGRHAPFYEIIYALPYFSTIRNPVKFLYPLHLALIILFGYGLQALWRQYLTATTSKAQSILTQLKSWWKAAPAFDKKWTIGSVMTLIASLFAWLLYASAKPQLVKHLQSVGFPDGQLAASIAQTSITEVGWSILFLVLSVGLITLMLSGRFSGTRAKWAPIALGLLLVADLGRANLPWIVYYDYKEKYATNPVFDLLRKNPWEHRVTAELAPRTRKFLVNEDEKAQFFGLLCYDWLQNQFQHHRIQSLDIIQMPRTPEFDEAYMNAFRSNLASCGRLWQLTNTRHVLGMTDLLDWLNQQLDPGKGRFRVHSRFNVMLKPGRATFSRLDDLTVVSDPNGPFAVFEFTGALPRAKLFTQWQVGTNDQATLQQLSSAEFDPAQLVLTANELPSPSAATNPTNQVSGSAEFAHYEPKNVRLNANAAAPSVLLLNDHYHPHWKVWVDGKPEPLLRCNYIMRGVYLTPGQHMIEFRFEPPATALYVSLASVAVGLGLCGFLAVSSKRAELVDPRAAPAPLERHPGAVNRRAQ